MNSPLFFRRFAGVVAAALLLISAASASAQGLLYSATTLPAPAQTGVVHFMQLITLPQGAGVYTINSITLGVNLTTGAANQNFAMYFYNGVDTSPTSTDALVNATYATTTGLSGTFGAQSGNQTDVFPLLTPVTLTLTGPSVAVEIYLLDNTDPANPAFSSDANGRFSAVAPTVGSAASYVWNDADLDSTFTGAEQTTFGQTPGAYVRFALGGALVPEPGTWALVAGSAGVLALALRRRKA